MNSAVVDIGGKFAASVVVNGGQTFLRFTLTVTKGINDAGGYLPPVSTSPFTLPSLPSSYPSS